MTSILLSPNTAKTGTNTLLFYDRRAPEASISQRSSNQITLIPLKMPLSATDEYTQFNLDTPDT